MSDSDDDVPCLVPTQPKGTGSAGAVSGMTTFELQQQALAREAKEGKAGRDWKVPITIITGFLGSGKSTLVRHILTEKHSAKIAVMVNEFGGSGDIERAMKVAKDGEESDDWVEMSNGCMCCKFKDQAVEALEGLVQRRGRFDHIVIETSGLADPQPLVTMFWQDLALESPLELNGVVTLVDALNIASYLGRSGPQGAHDGEGGFLEASQQIALANRVVINKADLVPDPNKITEVKKMIADLNPDSPIDVTSFAKGLDISALLHLPKSQDVQKIPGSFVPPPHTHEGKACSKPSCTTASHSDGIGTICVENPTPFASSAGIDLLMKQALWDTRDARLAGRPAPNVLRLKALFYVNGSAPQVVQAVGDLYDTTDAEQLTTDKNRLVIIGRNLNLVDWAGLLAEAVKHSP
eukprot:Sspe_Gene.18660::Locus_6730_Transcript_1_1_Confidence_1.000_Length_1350::g.18660::m.18660